ncbi:hypothetical protein KVR01_007009 [Diaporthe batatas]|uniref:uncharacterized protein n=1 Tax=Diaporthe batatas TaxID=748121 RepID=UPI001D035F50|nr:uncharacterized protein KVR01_007009 [Diaporthe batatas]KAG8163712.1 hypothetical protein KVR01_007009 [Diaporthe batatas]
MRALRLFPQRQLRCYAHGPGRARPSRLGETVSLDHFLQRSRVLALYRTVLRSIRSITDHETRDETRLFVRHEIERHRHQHIRYLLSTGKTQWEGFERFIDVVAPNTTLDRSWSSARLYVYTSPGPGH